MEEPFNPVSELYHFGIKDMKWGIQRFQTKAGKWTAEGLARRREREGYGDGDESTGKYTHEEIVNSGNPKLVNKYRSELSTFELRDAINRINTERQLDEILHANKRQNSAQGRAERAIKALTTAGTAIDGVYTWATKGNGKALFDLLSGKAGKDKEIAFHIRNGDEDWIRRNYKNMSLAQQEAASKALNNQRNLLDTIHKNKVYESERLVREKIQQNDYDWLQKHMNDISPETQGLAYTVLSRRYRFDNKKWATSGSKTYKRANSPYNP